MFSAKIREKSIRMTRHMGMLSVFLLAVVALILGLGGASPDCWAGGGGHGKKEKMPFKDAEFFIEFNSTAIDTGVQVFLDGDNWKKVTISDPKDRTIFMVRGKKTLGRLGLTELFFESVEPALSDLSLEDFMALFPEGDYKFKGITNDRIKLESEVEFTHVIPCGPEVSAEEEDGAVIIKWYPVEDVVAPAATDAASEVVCVDPEDMHVDLEIVSYQVILESDEVEIHLIIDLPGDATQLTIPPELIEPGACYQFEVLAKEESGNQTITESSFCVSE